MALDPQTRLATSEPGDAVLPAEDSVPFTGRAPELARSIAGPDAEAGAPIANAGAPNAATDIGVATDAADAPVASDATDTTAAIAAAGESAPRTALSDIVEAVEVAYAGGDLALTVELIERNPLSVWFGLRPERFSEIVEGLARGGAPDSVFLRVVSQMLFDSGSAAAQANQATESMAAYVQGLPVEVVFAVGRMFKERLAGRPVEAMRAAEALAVQPSALQPLFDSSKGWGLFSAVQAGVTAMLAGQFDRALGYFAQARMNAEVASLRFLTRDACVKAAVIESLFGDHDRARCLLHEADGVERTESWVELGIDAAYEIAASQVRAENPAEALRMLESVPLRDVGEIWSFYVMALHRTFTHAGNPQEGERRVAQFAQMPLPSVEGQGYTGSALLLASGLSRMVLGDLVGARDRFTRADGSLAVTKMYLSLLELAAGRPREALKLTAGMSEQTRGLRQLSVWRLVAIVGSYFVLGALDECEEALGFALGLPGGLGAHEAPLFPREVREFAAKKFEQWPHESDLDPRGFEAVSLRLEALSGRELEVLRELVAGHSREQIASDQHISMNTLKAHLRSVYRKLGVGSRGAAVLEAERRGLV